MFESRSDHLDAILALICEELQLPESLHQQAEERYNAVGRWLGDRESQLHPWHPTIYSQGSFRIGTTVHPLKGNEFDVDLVCELALGNQQVSPLAILNIVEQRFHQHSGYAKMIERKKRCIRLTYANEFHLDVLPARPTSPPQGTQLLIPDRELVEWLPSNPKGYADWFEGRSKLFLEEQRRAGVEPLPDRKNGYEKTPLHRAVQLLKRGRDVHFEAVPDSAPRSIVITTLAGHFFRGTLSTAAAFGEIVRATASAATENNGILRVVNPAQPQEVLSEQWAQEPKSYVHFRAWIGDLHRRWQAIQREANIESVATTLKELFGEPVTERAFKRLTTDRIERSRKLGALGVARSSGALALTPIAGVSPVRRNTFYGDA